MSGTRPASRLDKGPPCPYCGGETDAEYVDIGVGEEQVTPFMCGSCLAMQLNPYHDNAKATDEERRVGWWRGPATSADVFDFDVYNGLKRA